MTYLQIQLLECHYCHCLHLCLMIYSNNLYLDIHYITQSIWTPLHHTLALPPNCCLKVGSTQLSKISLSPLTKISLHWSLRAQTYSNLKMLRAYTEPWRLPYFGTIRVVEWTQIPAAMLERLWKGVSRRARNTDSIQIPMALERDIQQVCMGMTPDCPYTFGHTLYVFVIINIMVLKFWSAGSWVSNIFYFKPLVNFNLTSNSIISISFHVLSIQLLPVINLHTLSLVSSSVVHMNKSSHSVWSQGFGGY